MVYNKQRHQSATQCIHVARGRWNFFHWPSLGPIAEPYLPVHKCAPRGKKRGPKHKTMGETLGEKYTAIPSSSMYSQRGACVCPMRRRGSIIEKREESTGLYMTARLHPAVFLTFGPWRRNHCPPQQCGGHDESVWNKGNSAMSKKFLVLESHVDDGDVFRREKKSAH